MYVRVLQIFIVCTKALHQLSCHSNSYEPLCEESGSLCHKVTITLILKDAKVIKSKQKTPI